MPRDVLLALVLVAVLLNLALLVGVGIARWRKVGVPTRPRRPSVDRTLSTRYAQPMVAQRGRPAPWSPAGARPTAAIGAPARPIETFVPLGVPHAASATNGQFAAVVDAPPAGVTIEAIPEPPAPAVPDQPTPATAAAAGPPDAQPATPHPAPSAARPEPTARRGRRFVLPRNDEDKGRTERAIEAFLGEPSPSGSTSAHRPRRRARRHRAPGEVAGPIVLVAALGGFDQLRQTLGREGATRFADAYGEALRATLRSGDHVTDLGQGRLRIVVNADEQGAQALMERARGVCEPWLRLAPVPLALRVRPMPDPRSGNGSRPDGHPDRRRVEARPGDGSSSGIDSARAGAVSRSETEGGRRLAAG